LWRIGIHCLNRLDGRGLIENLYVIGMDEAAGEGCSVLPRQTSPSSLTKRVLSFASRFEDFADNLGVQYRRQPRAARVRVGGVLAL